MQSAVTSLFGLLPQDINASVHIACEKFIQVILLHVSKSMPWLRSVRVSLGLGQVQFPSIIISQSPPQLPQLSSTAVPFTIPAQSVHVELSPPHTPHSSATAVEPHALSHPPITESPPHTPAQSSTAVPFGVPAQSVHVELSPPPTPHASTHPDVSCESSDVIAPSPQSG